MFKDLLKLVFYLNFFVCWGLKYCSGGGCGWRFDVNIVVDFYSVVGSCDGVNFEVKFGMYV